MPVVYLLHENPEWIAPITAALDEIGTPYQEWSLADGGFDLGATPPAGMYFCKLSASAHSRGHPHAVDFSRALLRWLERHQRKVINGLGALELEASKAAQYTALQAAGIRIPRTRIACGQQAVLSHATEMGFPLIVKHNRGGKGLGVQLFQQEHALRTTLQTTDFGQPVDGLLILQEYIAAPESCIHRLEYIGGTLFYAVRVDTSSGFELCPAEACALPGQRAMFEIIPDFQHPVIAVHEALLKAHGVSVAGIEIIQDNNGNTYTYDININTNYNPAAEEIAGRFGAKQLAAFLTAQLRAIPD
ncbi:MAG: alpha-L-glutamate ligase [Hyphomicrobiales bacterium]|nr:hypothetical protein [Rickettsiales bacterium]MCP5362246.1 alpha-L-glutamate ligase [Hyphomicrobiales bacterium]